MVEKKTDDYRHSNWFIPGNAAILLASPVNLCEQIKKDAFQILNLYPYT